MNRTIEQWSGCQPEAMATEQSDVARTFAFADAKADILELHRENERLRDLLADLKAWDVEQYLTIPHGALEAEETARQLAHALAEEVNGPTFMADPVKPAPAQPSWQDAPTKPGVWFCDEGDICYTWTAHNIEILDQFDPGDGLRWFGPIPEDMAGTPIGWRALKDEK